MALVELSLRRARHLKLHLLLPVQIIRLHHARVEEQTRLRAVRRLAATGSGHAAVQRIRLVPRRRYEHVVLTGAQTAVKLLSAPLGAELLVFFLARLFDHDAAAFLIRAHAYRFLRGFVKLAQAVLARRDVLLLPLEQ